MFRRLAIPALMIMVFAACGICHAEPEMPQAPATISWLPHGYGSPMHLDSTTCTSPKGLWGFRTTPGHIGCWSQPLWGWDVNGYFQGPQESGVDPGMFQLPIGLVYPEHGPMIPPRGTARSLTRSAH